MILEEIVGAWKQEKLLTKLNEAGSLTGKQLSEIIKNTLSETEDYVDDSLEISEIIDPLLSGAVWLNDWDAYTADQQQQTISAIIDDEPLILETLNRMSLHILKLYKKEALYEVHKAYQGWKLFFYTVFHISSEIGGYKFTKNLYYSSIAKWLNDLEENYSPAKLSLLRTLFPIDREEDNATGNTKIDTWATDTLPVTKTPKDFLAFLIHPKKAMLAQKLREEYATEEGKLIRLLLEALRSLGHIVWQPGEGRKLHRSMRQYFGRHIGAAQSVVQTNVFDEKKDGADLQLSIVRLQHILDSLADEP